MLSADATLTSMTNQKAWSRPPLSLSFSLLMFTSSGLLVRYLKVFEKSNYSSVKWVRYMTRAGSYEIRCVTCHPSPHPVSSPLMVPQSLPHTPHPHEHRDKFVRQITCVHLSRHTVLNSDSNVRMLYKYAGYLDLTLRASLLPSFMSLTNHSDIRCLICLWLG